ncbi:hypothetical protein K438DRAFT_1993145 [Mycena galopus ATCC 62051]|nr:hypothetical protein K438DRAFT_1993145 [Mycena galopus ATCC 62051]
MLFALCACVLYSHAHAHPTPGWHSLVICAGNGIAHTSARPATIAPPAPRPRPQPAVRRVHPHPHCPHSHSASSSSPPFRIRPPPGCALQWSQPYPSGTRTTDCFTGLAPSCTNEFGRRQHADALPAAASLALAPAQTQTRHDSLSRACAPAPPTPGRRSLIITSSGESVLAVAARPHNRHDSCSRLDTTPLLAYAHAHLAPCRVRIRTPPATASSVPARTPAYSRARRAALIRATEDVSHVSRDSRLSCSSYRDHRGVIPKTFL